MTNTPAPLELAFTGSSDDEVVLALIGALFVLVGVGALRLGARRRALQ